MSEATAQRATKEQRAEEDRVFARTKATLEAEQRPDLDAWDRGYNLGFASGWAAAIEHVRELLSDE